MRHAKECGFGESDIIHIYDEKQDFVAAFRMNNGYLTFLVFTPELQLQPGFQDRYIGGKWIEVYRCSFFIKTRRIMEQGLQNLEFWTEYFETHPLQLLNQQSLYKFMYENLFLPGIQSLSMFVKIFKGKGLAFEETLTKEQAKELLCEEVNPPAFKEYGGFYPYTMQWGNQGSITGKVIHYGEKQLPALLLRVYLFREGKACKILFTENCFYADQELNVKTLLATPFHTDIDEAHLECFDRQYPSFGLINYVKTGGRNILIPLLAAKYDVPLELLAKSGCTVLADNYYQHLEKSKLVNPNGNNLEEYFGVPAKILRKLDTSCLEIEELFTKLYLIRLSAPEFLQMERLTICSLLFVLRNEVRNPTQRRTEIRGYHRFSKQTKLQMARYLSKKDYVSLYRLYVDYLNMCHTMNRYISGYTPEFLEAAHDMAVQLTRTRTTKQQDELFRKRVSEEGYQSLTSQYEEGKNLFAEEEYIICAPKEARDLIAEGASLHHCVGTYIPNVVHGTSQIYFLREKKNVEKPYATIEVEGDDVVQVKAFGNSKASDSAQAFVRKWAKEKQLRIQTRDLSV